jgi:hypothetical protein
VSTPLVSPELLSHGTIECSDIAATRRFLNEFLGVDVVRPLPEAQYLWKGGPWSVVCVCIEDSEAKDQDPRNHFKLSVQSPAAVAAARDAAIAHKDAYGIRQIGEIETSAGASSFKLQDLNRVWWEITTIDQGHDDRLFAAGDQA